MPKTKYSYLIYIFLTGCITQSELSSDCDTSPSKCGHETQDRVNDHETEAHSSADGDHGREEKSDELTTHRDGAEDVDCASERLLIVI